MKHYYTTQWKWATFLEVYEEGHTCDHSAFDKKGEPPESGSTFFLLTNKAGRIKLHGMYANVKICGRNEAQKLLKNNDLWDAEYHIISSNSYPMLNGIDITDLAEHKKLKFLGKNSFVNFDKPGYVNVQSVRNVRELTPESGDLLERLYLEQIGAKAVSRAHLKISA